MGRWGTSLREDMARNVTASVEAGEPAAAGSATVSSNQSGGGVAC